MQYPRNGTQGSYVARVDCIHRRAYPDAVFWHSLAPDKLEPPLIPVSLKTQYVPTDMRPLCRSQLGGSYSICILVF